MSAAKRPACRLCSKAEAELDGLVNSTGITDDSGIEDLAVDRWAQVINVNLTGAFGIGR